MGCLLDVAAVDYRFDPAGKLASVDFDHESTFGFADVNAITSIGVCGVGYFAKVCACDLGDICLVFVHGVKLCIVLSC